jgi:hypothetical protein
MLALLLTGLLSGSLRAWGTLVLSSCVPSYRYAHTYIHTSPPGIGRHIRGLQLATIYPVEVYGFAFLIWAGWYIDLYTYVHTHGVAGSITRLFQGIIQVTSRKRLLRDAYMRKLKNKQTSLVILRSPLVSVWAEADTVVVSATREIIKRK